MSADLTHVTVLGTGTPAPSLQKDVVDFRVARVALGIWLDDLEARLNSGRETLGRAYRHRASGLDYPVDAVHRHLRALGRERCDWGRAIEQIHVAIEFGLMQRHTREDLFELLALRSQGRDYGDYVKRMRGPR